MFFKEGPHKYLMRTIKVSDFCTPPTSAEPSYHRFDTNADPLPYLEQNDNLEHALRSFDETGEAQLPVISKEDDYQIVAYASQAKALAHFNKELVGASEEEHRL